MSRKDEWQAEKFLYENQYRSITGRKTKIIEIPPQEGELGYTSSDGMIHLARRHAMMAKLPEDQKQFFRMGVFAHEMCHQIFTDFAYLEETLKKRTWPAERNVISLFANLVEDPAIEYEAETEFGGDLLAALRFSIAHIYEKSPEISESEEPFSQLISALIQFGDMGLLKGRFSSKEAYDYFCQIAPEFNAAVINPDPRARIDCAVRWAKLTKPLWEKETEKEENELFDELKRLMDDNAISETNGSGATPKIPESKPESGKREERRNRLAKKLQEQEEEERGSEPKPSDGQSSDAEDSSESSGSKSENSSEKDEDSGKESGKASSGEDDGESERESKEESGSDTGTGNDESESEEDGKEEGNDGGEKETQNKESDKEDDSEGESESRNDSDGNPSSSPGWGFEDFEDGENKIDREFAEIGQDTLNEIKRSIQKSADGIAKRRKKEEINYDIKSKYYGNVSCLNEVVHVDKKDRNAFQSEYANILKEHAKDIRLLSASLSRIFQQDTGGTTRALSGRYNVVRASKQSTAKIFDRRKAPKELEDLAVMLLIDESGSMHGIKEVMARDTAVVLAETFASLHIPCYIMGFTTGGGYGKRENYDAVHHHYVSWKNTKEERLALAGIHAEASNFDGYAIRNASMILQQKSAEHKILFVVSDGYPACRKYHNRSEGIADTAAAIQEAKKGTTVLGIGIGDCEPKTLKHMYKGTFVHVKDPEDLSMVLTMNLKKILKKI